jgi:hypothetical protein
VAVVTPQQLDRAYTDARNAMLACLDLGWVDTASLRSVQDGMANLKPSRVARSAQIGTMNCATCSIR